MADPTPQKRPRPEEFTDHRAYLQAMIPYLKATRPQFSYRYFSRLAGFSSPNFLKLVADGQRGLSVASIGRFAKGLGLDEAERASFETLVLLDQAGSDEERNRYWERLRAAADQHGAARIEAAQYDAWSDWWTMPVWELMHHPGFQESPAWIGRQLHPQITRTEASKALRTLEALGLAVRDEHGALRARERTVSTGPRVRSLAIRNHHRAMLDLAAQALDTIPLEDRDITSLTLSLTRERFEEVRRRVEALRRDLLALADAEPPTPDAEVHQVCFQLFPLTRKANTTTERSS